MVHEEVKWKVYNWLLKPIYQTEKPTQPKREDRLFLRYASKPPITIVSGGPGFYYEEAPLIDVAPCIEIPDLNFRALQYWLDHLGPAIYNPINAYQDDEGEYHVDGDGAHRLRCLWEIGEPLVRVMTRRFTKKSSEYRQWIRTASKQYSHPSLLHFKKTPAVTWRQYYPCICPATPTLLAFYEEKKDGAYYRDTLDTPMSFREILSQNRNLSYRMDILGEMLKFDMKGKSLLDLGCYFGHYMFLLMENGGIKHAVGVDNYKFRVDVAQHLSLRRGMNRGNQSAKFIQGDINEHVESLEESVDVVLLMNVFHHLLAKDSARGWNTLNTLLDNCDLLFLMTQNIKGVFDEWGGDIEKAVEDKTGATLKPLIQTRYRKRLLYRLEK